MEQLLRSLQSMEVVPLQTDSNWTEVMKQLSEYLNRLVSTDFHRLLSILYRIDISESKLQTALKAAADTETAGETIACLIVERQKQKIRFRNQYQKIK